MLVAKPNNLKHINDITDWEKGCLDSSKTILIEVPSVLKGTLLEDRAPELTDPNGKEKDRKYTLSEIDSFVFQYSTDEGEKELRDTLNQYGYHIPQDYGFWIVYKHKTDYYGEHAKYRYFEPIYGENKSLMLFLSDLAQLEIENENLSVEEAKEEFLNSKEFSNIFNRIVLPDIKNHGSMTNDFLDWVDTRGNINPIRKKAKSSAVLKELEEELGKGRQFNLSRIQSFKKYSLADVLNFCNHYKDYPLGIEVLRKTIGSYKELRGYLLHRYEYFKDKVYMPDYEKILKSTKLPKELQGLNQSYYDLLRNTDYTIEKLDEEGILPNELKSDPMVMREVEFKIKERKKKDIIPQEEVKYYPNDEEHTITYNGEKRLIEHEDVQLGRWDRENDPRYPRSNVNYDDTTPEDGGDGSVGIDESEQPKKQEHETKKVTLYNEPEEQKSDQTVDGDRYDEEDSKADSHLKERQENYQRKFEESHRKNYEDSEPLQISGERNLEDDDVKKSISKSDCLENQLSFFDENNHINEQYITEDTGFSKVIKQN